MILNSRNTWIETMAMLAAVLYSILSTQHIAFAQVSKSVQDPKRSVPRIELDRPEQAAELARDVLGQIGNEKGIGDEKDIEKEKEDEEYAISLGFNSTEELRRSELGTPLQVYNISFERLQKFTKDASLKDLIYDTRILMYPLLIDRQLKSIITVEPSTTKGWHPTGVGYEQLTPLLRKYRSTGADVLIVVSGLGLKFLGLKPIGPPSDEDFSILSITEKKEFDLTPGPPARSARATFAELSTKVSKWTIPDLLDRPSSRGTAHP